MSSDEDRRATAAGDGAGAGSHCVRLLTCPVCGEPLARAGRSLRCPHRHTFDLAREGYVDLLPAGHGRSAIRGDTADMIRARQAFLDQGYYAPLSRAVVAAALDHFLGSDHYSEARPRTVLEVGCGDGGYLGAVARNLKTDHDPARQPAAPCFFGLDVSTAAVRAAARRHPHATFFVNDVRHRICMADHSVDVLLDIFAPRNPTEFARVTAPGALLLVVIPTHRHLAELRHHVPLLHIGLDKRTLTAHAFAGPFHLTSERALDFHLELDGPDIANILRMTPSAWHADDRAVAAAAELAAVQTTASFTLLSFARSDTRE